jgi:hypothetical protein
MPAKSPPPERRRPHRAGAPPGNLNALKHGFYTGGAVFAPPSRRQETQSPPPGRRRRAGAPPGNLNALKHGFYTGGAVFAPPSRRQETQSPPPGRRRRAGAPPGNTNALKHGFYTRRFKRAHLAGVESTDSSGLIEEIALIRVITRRLVESIDLDGDPYDSG